MKKFIVILGLILSSLLCFSQGIELTFSNIFLSPKWELASTNYGKCWVLVSRSESIDDNGYFQYYVWTSSCSFIDNKESKCFLTGIDIYYYDVIYNMWKYPLYFNTFWVITGKNPTHIYTIYHTTPDLSLKIMIKNLQATW